MKQTKLVARVLLDFMWEYDGDPNIAKADWGGFLTKEDEKKLDQAKAQLKQLVLDCVPKEKKASKYNPDNGDNNHSFRLGVNHARTEILSNLKELFDE